MLSETEEAFKALNLLIDRTSGYWTLMYARTDPAFNELREDPRWEEFMDRLEQREYEGHTRPTSD